MKQEDVPSEAVRTEALKRLWELFSRVPADVSLADELIAELREETRRSES